MQKVRPSSSPRKHSVSRSLSAFLIALTIVIAVPVIFIIYAVVSTNANHEQIKDHIVSNKNDIIVPPGCNNVSEKYVSDSFGPVHYFTRTFKCDKTLSPAEIDAYLKQAFDKTDYLYSSDDYGRRATQNGITISYYKNNEFPIDEPTDTFIAKITD